MKKVRAARSLSRSFLFGSVQTGRKTMGNHRQVHPWRAGDGVSRCHVEGPVGVVGSEGLVETVRRRGRLDHLPWGP